MVRKALVLLAAFLLAASPSTAGTQGPGAPLKLKKEGKNLDNAQFAVDIDAADIAFDGVGAYTGKPNLTYAGEGGKNKPPVPPKDVKGGVFKSMSSAPPSPTGGQVKAEAKAQAGGDKTKAKAEGDDKGGGTNMAVVGAAVGGLVGAAVGFAVGGPIGAAAGFLAGALVGALIGYLIDKRKKEQGGGK